MSKASSIPRYSKSRWPMRFINLGGAITVTLVILWETGLTSRDWFERVTAPKAQITAKAPARLPSKPISVAPSTPKGNESSVSPVPLRLLLVNVQLGPTPHEGAAQIGVIADSPQTYQAGAVLENGARLAEIHADYVLLQKDGRSTRLFLEGKPNRAASNSPLLMVGNVSYATPAAKITSSDTLTNYIRPAPLYEGNEIVGFQVYPAAKTGVFYQMGLQPGDVITEIDGSPMTDPEMAWEVFRQMAQGGVLGATVKRHGTMVSVKLDGTLILNAEQARTQPSSTTVLATASP